MPCWAANTDRFLKITAKGLNESLYQAIQNGDLGSASWSGETPTGTGTAYSVTATPTFLMLFQDGTLMTPAEDYSLSGKDITLTASPTTGQTLYSVYSK